MRSELLALHTLMQRLHSGICRVIIGKETFVSHIVMAFISGAHILVEDMPGVGKTTAIKALWQLLDDTASYGRIQCTPDLLPYDITGVEMYDQTTHQFHFVSGPVFSDIVLADEINRATPKTQSALLEAMAEKQVTVAGKTYPLSAIFWLAATQNPLEQGISYALPIAELDRFAMRLSPGYPSFDSECDIATQSHISSQKLEIVDKINKHDIISQSALLHLVHCDARHVQLVVDIAQKTRQHDSIAMGVSPRGPIALLQLAKAHAVYHQRDYITDEDIQTLLPLVYSHRIITHDHRTDIPALLLNLYQQAQQVYYK